MTGFTGVKMTVDKLPDLYVALRHLANTRVLAGIPAERGARLDKGQVNNAAIGYIQENGDSAGRIPPRPFLVPTVEAMSDDIQKYLRLAGEKALKADLKGSDAAFNALGLLAQNRVRGAINAGIAPALARSTLLGRIRARTAIKGAKAELANRDGGADAGTDLAKPLVATGQLRNSITYVIRTLFAKNLFGRDQQVGKKSQQQAWNEKYAKDIP